MFIIISYDIQDDRRRTKIMKTLKDYGQWVQYSVFECKLEKMNYLKMKARLDKLICPEEDSVRFYFLCEKDVARIERLGGVQPLSEGAILLGFDSEVPDEAN
ncbi:MAG TPA: CRISPR-associated endonuclease Cas2 [Candidatus Fraserbacteria bacterium]|nr:CRISPR-associated endonuclease Cas2 [Candidatus Fraserbacteria bacterium]